MLAATRWLPQLRTVGRVRAAAVHRAMAAAAFTGVAPDSGDADYAAAVQRLNELQTNAQVVEALRRAGATMNARSIPEMQEFVRRLGYTLQDLNGLNVVHVTGTKGKGSTCAFVEAALRECGLRTGLYTSPHLVEVRERIRINGAPVSRAQFARYFFESRDRLLANQDLPAALDMPAAMPTYFRFLTLMAFHTFVQERTDVVVLEVGIGGTYDATNVVPRPVVCGVTSIGLDHQSLLGHTHAEIAEHKGGIIKRGVPAYTVTQVPAAASVLERIAHEQQTTIPVAPDVTATYPGIRLGIPGAHQEANASLAAALVRQYLTATRGGVSDQAVAAIRRGLERAYWPGRCQRVVVPGKRLCFVIDGAHTVESMAAFVRWRRDRAEPAWSEAALLRLLVFNCTHERDPANLLAPLVQLHADGDHRFDGVCFVPNVAGISSLGSDQKDVNVAADATLADQHRMLAAWRAAIGPPDTARPLDELVRPSVDAAVQWAEATRDRTGRPVEIVITGSLLLGGVAAAVLRQRYDIDVTVPPRSNLDATRSASE